MYLQASVRHELRENDQNESRSDAETEDCFHNTHERHRHKTKSSRVLASRVAC